MDELARYFLELVSHPFEWLRALIVGLGIELARRLYPKLRQVRTTRVGASLAMPYRILGPMVASGTSAARVAAAGSEAIGDSGTVYVKLTPGSL